MGHTSNLRTVRDATGMSQGRFAARVGTNKGNIENYEMGRAKLPERLAARIGAFVGVIPRTLQGGEKLISWDGEPFSVEKYEQWQSLGYLPRQIPILIHSAQKHLELLLQAAIGTRNNTPHVLRELLIDLNHFVHSRAERLGLAPIIEAALRAKPLQMRRKKTTVGELRAEFGDNPGWKAIDTAKLADSHTALIGITSYSLFRPFVGFGMDRGRPAFANITCTDLHICDVEIAGKHFQVIQEHVQANYLRPRQSRTEPTVQPTLPFPQSSPAAPPSPARSAKTASPRRASHALGNGEKASSSPRARAARKSPRRS